jgi:hypothetical protein
LASESPEIGLRRRRARRAPALYTPSVRLPEILTFGEADWQPTLQRVQSEAVLLPESLRGCVHLRRRAVDVFSAANRLRGTRLAKSRSLPLRRKTERHSSRGGRACQANGSRQTRRVACSMRMAACSIGRTGDCSGWTARCNGSLRRGSGRTARCNGTGRYRIGKSTGPGPVSGGRSELSGTRQRSRTTSYGRVMRFSLKRLRHGV